MNNTEEYFEESEGAGIDDDNFTNPGSGEGFDSGNDFIAPVTKRSQNNKSNLSSDNNQNDELLDESELELGEYSPDLLDISTPNQYYFDVVYYRQQNPDVAAAETGSIRHFIEFGAAEGREFRSTFDSEYYLEQNPDVAAAGVNPYLHFLQTGKDESREHRGDPIHYQELNLNWEELLSGWLSGSRSNLQIDELTGMELSSTNFLAAEDLIDHPIYSSPSDLEFRTNSFDFDRNYYLEQNPDVTAAGVDPYSHYIQFGKDEGRVPYADFDPTVDRTDFTETVFTESSSDFI